MAYVLCQHHGGHIAPLLCSHLREAVRLSVPLPEVFYVQAWYLDKPAWSHHICPECARENGISENPTIWRDDASLDRLFAMKCEVAPECPVCFSHAKSRSLL